MRIMAEFSIKNLFKQFLREKFGFKTHQYPAPGMDVHTLPVYENLKKLIDFEAIGNLNLLEWTTEAKWEDGKGTKLEGKSVGDKRKEIVEIYTGWREKEDSVEDVGREIRDSIGPFIDRSALFTEGRGADQGTGVKPENISIRVRNTTVSTTTSGAPLKFSIPKEKTITYSDGRSYNVAFFGRRNTAYWNQLKNDIKDICEAVQQEALNQETDSQKKELIINNIRLINKKIEALINRFETYIAKFEEQHRSNLIGGEGVQKHFAALETRKKDFWDLKLKDFEVHYTHTYRVVKPKVPKIEWVDQEMDDGTIEKVPVYVYDVNGNIIYDELKDHVPANWKRDEEMDFGLDRNGFPLEVGDGKTLFEGEVIDEGVVLLDIFEGRSPRDAVPKEFIVDCDLLETITWIDTNYDAYRDDLRDARYFSKATTVMERIMTELQEEYGIPDIKHPQTMNDIETGRQAEITMNLNRPGTPTSVAMKINATHLNPAFDLRAKKAAKHIGRKYYYNLQDDIQREKSTEPTITTRGAAMYILYRVIEETKYWDSKDDPNKPPGVIQVLDAIGGEINGFDIGPNMRLDSPQPGWGMPFSRNPFKLR